MTKPNHPGDPLNTDGHRTSKTKLPKTGDPLGGWGYDRKGRPVRPGSGDRGKRARRMRQMNPPRFKGCPNCGTLYRCERHR